MSVVKRYLLISEKQEVLLVFLITKFLVRLPITPWNFYVRPEKTIAHLGRDPERPGLKL